MNRGPKLRTLIAGLCLVWISAVSSSATLALADNTQTGGASLAASEALRPKRAATLALADDAQSGRASLAASDALRPKRAATLAPTAAAQSAAASLAAGDALWAKRAATLAGPLAEPETIEAAIEHYRAAQAASPSALEPRWKLLRALHYAVDFADRSEEDKQSSVKQAVALANDAVALLEAGGGDETDRASLYFWSSIAWGTKASRAGLLTIVREGLATKMHDFAQRTAELDPSVDQGGALRLLSRLHATIPQVPFISGWVDREKSLVLAEQAQALNPGHPGNQLILALALLEREPDREAEARTLLEGVASLSPRADYRAEDLAIAQQARERLEELRRDSK